MYAGSIFNTISCTATRMVCNALDPFGRRAYTATAMSSGSITNWHAYVGMHCVADLDADGTVLRSYTYGPGVDNFLAITDHTTASPTVLLALTDHLGTVHALADSSGSIVESYAYDAWGNVLAVYDSAGLEIPNHKSQISNRFLFQGREHSFATGLTNFRARWYDPATGRWLSNDPIGISGGLNQYVFCGNDPVNFVDPMGEVVWPAIKIAGAIFAVTKGVVAFWNASTASRNISEARQHADWLYEIGEYEAAAAQMREAYGDACAASVELIRNVPGTSFTGPLPGAGPSPGNQTPIGRQNLTGRPGYVRHRGYVRGDTGTYVPPHYQRPPGSGLAPPDNNLYPRGNP